MSAPVLILSEKFGRHFPSPQKERVLRRSNLKFTMTDKHFPVKIQTSVVIPCFNEALGVKKALTEIFNVLGDKTDFEIITVNDGSLDETPQYWTSTPPTTLSSASSTTNRTSATGDPSREAFVRQRVMSLSSLILTEPTPHLSFPSYSRN